MQYPEDPHLVWVVYLLNFVENEIESADLWALNSIFLSFSTQVGHWDQGFSVKPRSFFCLSVPMRCRVGVLPIYARREFRKGNFFENEGSWGAPGFVVANYGCSGPDGFFFPFLFRLFFLSHGLSKRVNTAWSREPFVEDLTGFGCFLPVFLRF